MSSTKKTTKENFATLSNIAVSQVFYRFTKPLFSRDTHNFSYFSTNSLNKEIISSFEHKEKVEQALKELIIDFKTNDFQAIENKALQAEFKQIAEDLNLWQN